MTAHQADFHIATMCRVLGISSSGYYAWVKRAPSRRSQDNTALTKKVRTIHAVSRGTYGAPRVHAELAADGIPASRNRVARVMREANIVGVSRRKFVVTTVRDGGRQAPDLVERAFTADAPNVLWVADITYVPTWMGFLYLAVVLDVFSRRIVGWSMSITLHVTVVLDALSMALTMRRPRGVIHHSDQGSQYTSIAFGNRCRKAGVRPSMGSVGDCGACPRAGEAGPVGQCDGGEFLRHAGMRAARPEPLQNPRAGAQRRLRLHRRLLQSAAPALVARVRLAGGIRAQTRRVCGFPRRTRSCRRARGPQGQALAGA